MDRLCFQILKVDKLVKDFGKYNWSSNLCGEIVLPIIKRFTPSLVDMDIESMYSNVLSVQPLSPPNGIIFHLNKPKIKILNNLSILGVDDG